MFVFYLPSQWLAGRELKEIELVERPHILDQRFRC